MPSIKIIEVDGGGIAFQPDRPNAQRNQPLGARAGDLVTWNNMTNRKLTLQSIPPGTFITNAIPAGTVSSPIFQVPSTGLTYSCVDPPEPQHSIVIVPAKAAPSV